MKKDYLLIAVADLANMLTSRPNHLIRYLLSSGYEVTVAYRASEFHTQFCYKRGKLKLLRVPFPSFFYLLAPICGIWIFLFLLFFERSRYKVGIALGVWAGFTCILLKKVGKIKLYVYEDVDYVPGNHQNPVLRKIVHIAEVLCIKNSDLVVSTGNFLAKLRKIQGAKRVIVVPNGVILDLFRKACIKKPHPPTMIYVGYLDWKFGVDLPIKSLPMILKKIPDAHFLILGDGPYRKKLENLISNLRLEKHVSILGKVPHKKVPEFLARADVGIATFKNTDIMFFAFPLKVIEYIAANLPVIGTKVGEVGLFIEKNKIGEIIDYSVRSFALAFIELIQNKNKYRIYAQNAKKLSESYDWSSLFKKEESIISSVLISDIS